MPMQVATAGDGERVRDIATRSYRDHYAALWREVDLAAWLDAEFDPATIERDITSGDASYYFWQEDGADVGFAKLRWNRPTPATTTRGAELQKIYFLARCTRQGHGRRLLAACMQEAANRGEAQVWLDVLKTNSGARALYERAGFRVIGEHDAVLRDNRFPMWVMQYPLGARG